jgi:hypothetical protein
MIGQLPFIKVIRTWRFPSLHFAKLLDCRMRYCSLQAASAYSRGFVLFPKMVHVCLIYNFRRACLLLRFVGHSSLSLTSMMRWTFSVLTGALSLSLASASSSPTLEAKFIPDPAADLLSRNAASQPYVIHNATTPNLFSRFLHHFDLRQEAGRCGTSAGGASCVGNQCCSTFDYCGTDPEYVENNFVF